MKSDGNMDSTESNIKFLTCNRVGWDVLTAAGIFINLINWCMTKVPVYTIKIKDLSYSETSHCLHPPPPDH